MSAVTMAGERVDGEGGFPTFVHVLDLTTDEARPCVLGGVRSESTRMVKVLALARRACGRCRMNVQEARCYGVKAVGPASLVAFAAEDARVR